MESTPSSSGLSRQQHLWIAGIIWTLVGAGLLTMGMKFWFQFPYLGLLDTKHITFGAIALSLGLAKGKFVLDRTAGRVIERVDALQEPNPFKSVFQMFGIKTIALIVLMMMIGLGLRMMGVSYEIRGLIYLAVGAALLWSCRRYWGAAIQKTES